MMADDDLAREDAPVADGEAGDRAAGPALDKRALLKRIVTTTGASVSQARKILDATLTEIAAALDAGSSLALPPLGKLRPVRKADQGGTAVHTLRLRRTPPLARIKAPAAAGDKVTAEEDETPAGGTAGKAAGKATGKAEVKPGVKAQARMQAGAATSRTSPATAKRPARGSAAGRKATPVADEDDEDDDA